MRPDEREGPPKPRKHEAGKAGRFGAETGTRDIRRILSGVEARRWRGCHRRPGRRTDQARAPGRCRRAVRPGGGKGGAWKGVFGQVGIDCGFLSVKGGNVALFGKEFSDTWDERQHFGEAVTGGAEFWKLWKEAWDRRTGRLESLPPRCGRLAADCGMAADSHTEARRRTEEAGIVTRKIGGVSGVSARGKAVLAGRCGGGAGHAGTKEERDESGRSCVPWWGARRARAASGREAVAERF